MMIFKLRETMKYNWYLYSSSGYLLTGPFFGNEYTATEWAKAYMSSYNCTSLEIERKEK